MTVPGKTRAYLGEPGYTYTWGRVYQIVSGRVYPGMPGKTLKFRNLVRYPKFDTEVNDTRTLSGLT